MPALSTYVRHFGNWNESLRQAGFQPRNKLSKEIKQSRRFNKPPALPTCYETLTIYMSFFKGSGIV
ncbi:homing endonuclease associated repeat-containing protein [Bacillus mycoides]